MALRRERRYTNALVANKVIAAEFGLVPQNKYAKKRLADYERYQERILACDGMTREKWHTLSIKLKYIWIITYHIGPPYLPKVAITALQDGHSRNTIKLVNDAIEYPGA